MVDLGTHSTNATHASTPRGRDLDGLAPGWTLPLARGRTLRIDRPLVMGILNVTPDSFSDGGVHLAPEAAAQAAIRMLRDGAHILDVGGESTRPGHAVVPADEEIRRVVPAIRAIKAAAPDCVVSIDTSKATVARAAIKAGADFVNDVSSLADPDMAHVVREAGCAIVLMRSHPIAAGAHRTTERTERTEPPMGRSVDSVSSVVGPGREVDTAAGAYRTTERTERTEPPMGRSVDSVSSVGGPGREAGIVDGCARQLADLRRTAVAAGIPDGSILLDPGLGFGDPPGADVAANMALLQGVAAYGDGRPVLIGASRKRFIGTMTGIAEPAQRVAGSVAAAVLAVQAGAAIVRVHDVAQTVHALRRPDSG